VLRPAGATALHSDVEAQAGGLFGSGGTVRVGEGMDRTARTIAHHWSRWAVLHRQLLTDLFEFKFDRLNMNSTI
jgi:hypothetical protein